METINSKIDKIRKELDGIESQANILKREQPDLQNQIDWLVQNMKFVIADIAQVENAAGNGKSYATLARGSRNQLESAIRQLNIWQQTGIKPEIF